MTVFADFTKLPAEARKQLAILENFIGDVDGKTICIPAADNTFIDDGMIDADDAVQAINALAALLSS